MLKVAVLGAGYMGSAITFPLSDNRIETNLWGTWLDDDLISAALEGQHPKLKKPIPSGVKLFYSRDFLKAIDSCEVFFIGIASEGFVNIFQKLIDSLDGNRKYYFFKLTKGLVEHEGKIMRASEAARLIYSKKFKDKDFYFTTIGGPVRALDLSNRTPSATAYGIEGQYFSEIKELASNFNTDYYRIFMFNDPEAVEICSTFKNIYAITAGICDGLYREKKPDRYFNLVSFLFTQSSLEMAKICELCGRNKDVVFNYPGVGDLHVTSVAGRNRKYGELVGRGINGKEAFEQMFAEGEYGEGYIALKLCIPWLKERLNIDAKFIKKEFPLLHMLYSVIFENKEISSSIKDLIISL